MKRKFTLLIAALALLTMIVQPGRAWGQTKDSYSYTFTAKQFTANNQTKTLGDADWTLTGDGGYWGYDGTKGQQFGSGSAPYKTLTLSTSDIPGTITEIKINTSGANSIAATMNVTVGGNAYDNQITLTNSATEYTFTGSASGAIAFNYTQTSSKAIYIKSISVTYSTGGGTTPSITASNVDIAYDATNGSIAYEINNPVSGGELSAALTTGDWLTVGTVGETVPFTCSANPASAERSATVTLTYTYNTTETVSKNVTVTQAGNPNVVYTTIPELFAAATTTETNVNVTFNNWVVSGVSTNGKNVFVTDGTNGFVIFDNGGNLGDTYHVNDHITGTTTASLVLYTGFAELKNVNTTNLTMTSGEAPAFSDVAMADLAGVNTGALVQYNNLTCSVSNNKYYLSDGTTTIQVYNALYAFEALEDGETYNITGVYQQFNNTKEVLPRSADDIVEVVAPITPTLATENVNIASNITGGTITYTLENPTQDGVLTAAVTAGNEGNWLTLGTVGANVPFTCTENTTTTARTATVTLTYTYNTSETITATAVVTQAAPIVPPTPGSWVLTNLADLTSSDIFVIVGTDSDEDTYALPYNGGQSGAPAAVEITIANNALSEEPAAELQWNLSGNATDGYTFYPNGSTNTWLYCNTTAASGSNNNIRVGTGDRKVFELDSNGYLVTNDDNVDRYLSIYVNSGTAQDWRGYINSNSAPTIAFYKKVNSTDPSITITPAAITEVPCYGGGGLLEVTYANMGDTPNPQIIKCDSDGNPATYDWLTAEFENGTANIRGTISANNSNADRTAYLKVCGTAVNSETVCSNIVSITQLAYPTITTATLPFAFDGDNEELATTAGLAQAGLGSSYGDSPKLKFKETGSFVILHFNEAPNTLTFDIKGDGFDGTFKVQTSADNVTYTDLKEYTSSNLTDNLVSESFNTLNANVRYIKWVYTAATSGKVRLGNIGLTNFSPSITLNTYAISVDANQHDGTLDATYEFIDFINDPEVVWFESDGVTPAADPDWIIALINTDKDFDYTIAENNNTASRTAYFKVYALAETSGDDVYSDLVTVTQEGKVTLYTIMFDTDGGTFVGNDDFNSEIVQKQTGVYSLPSATKNNVTFAGWKLDGTDDIYAAGAQYEVTADASFTAQWSNAVTATITFGSAQGSTNINNTSITGDDSAGNTWTITTEGTTSFTPNAGYAQIGSSSKPATSITFTTTLSNDVTITAFSAKFGGFSGTAGTIFLKVGETTVGTGALNAGADVIVASNSTEYGKVLTVTVTNIDKGVKAYYISYSYELGTDPIIIAPASVDLAYNATSGEIGYSIVNPTTATLTADPSATWIAIDNIDNTKVTFTTTENTEYIPRQGTITLSYEGADDVEVTVNQAAAPMPAENFALFTGNLVEGDYIIYYNGYAMKNTVTSGRLDYVDDVTPNNNIIATDNAAIIWHIAPSDEYWTIYSADADAFAASTGAKNKAQMLADGTDDKALWAVTGTEVYEFENKERAASSSDPNNKWLRNNGTYGFACYASSTGGALTLYKRTSEIVSYDKVITGYGDNEGGYYLIASPVSVDPTNVEGMVELDNTTPSYPLYDLYRFDQTAEAEWYNYKAHNFYLTPGKGYLYANKEGVELSFNGMPYEGDGNINLTYDENVPLKGWNLIGNPYGSSANLNKPYYILNSDGSELRSETETEAINAMEGVFVQATEAGQTAQFTLVSNSKEQRSIAQAKIMVSGNNGKVIDNAIIRFDGGESLGKFQINNNHTRLYIPQDNTDYAIVNAEAEGQMPLNFKAETTGNYTISFKLNGANVGYLHLIDKATGEDINLFTNPEYSFVGSPRDAEDRFIICFSNNTTNDNFAYQNGSDIIVNGNGELQVFDVTGRMVMNTKINGIQTVNVPATGMYIFRMVGESVQTQKIVVR